MHPSSVNRELVSLATSLFERGFSVGTAGNISVRLEDGGFLMTPTNSSLGRLDPDRLSVLDIDGQHISGPPPSKEVTMHLAMYASRPGAGAVVHLHSTYATAVSCLRGPDEPAIPAFTPYFVMRVGSQVPVVPYFRPGTTAALSDIEAAARLSPGVLLANHGSIVAGNTLEDAVNAAEELESAAQLAFLLAGRDARTLSDHDVADLEEIRLGR